MMNLQRSAAFRRTAATAAVALAGLSLAACSSDSESGTGNVVVGFYPLEYLATTIGGDAVDVESLAQPGAEPHDMELTTQQVGALATASLVVYQRGMQPAVDDAVDSQDPQRSLDVATVVEQMASEGDDGHHHGGDDHDHDGHDHGGEDHDHEGEEGHDHDHGGLDPHVWLDPMLMKDMAGAVKDELVEIDPGNEDTFVENYEALAADLDALDEEFTTGLAQCESTEIVTTHTAFGYLAKAYGLEQVGILGLNAEEPSPQQLDEVQQFVTDHDVSTIFFETGVSDDYAKTVADATGAQTAVLLPLETAPDGGDYISAMQANLQALKTALNCS